MNRPPRPRPSARTGAPGTVRIIGGRWRGTKLPVPDIDGLRPTSDRVRETLFNWLMPALPGSRVLDLFAGSGALGLEAVSRGAAQAVLVERDPAQAAGLRAVAERLQAGDQVQVAQDDAVLLRSITGGNVSTLNPVLATDSASIDVITFLFEGLFEADPATAQPMPALTTW